MDFLNVGMSMSLVSFLGLFSFSLSVLSIMIILFYFTVILYKPVCFLMGGRKGLLQMGGEREKD